MKPPFRILAFVALCLAVICAGWLLTHSKKRHHRDGERHRPAASAPAG